MRISVIYRGVKRIEAARNTYPIGKIADEVLYVLRKEAYEIDTMFMYTEALYDTIEDVVGPGIMMGGEHARFNSDITAESLTVVVNDRRRNEEGNVLPSMFYNQYNTYFQELEDMRYAQQLQMQSNIMENLLYQDFNPDLDDGEDADDGEEDGEGEADGREADGRGVGGIRLENEELIRGPPITYNDLMGVIMEAALPRMDARERLLYSLLMVPPPIHADEVEVPPPPPPGQGSILANLFARLGGAAMMSQQDVKVVCTAAEIAACPRMKYSELPEQLNTACNVCLTDFEPSSTVMQLTGCKHYFHPECITEWLTKSSNKCPVCREPTGKGTPLL